MKHWLLLACLPLVACVQVVSSRVVVHPTSTPGVAYVTVASNICGVLKDAHHQVCADYVLVCDGRHADGMHCSVPPEVALDRVSVHPAPAASAKQLDLGVGTLDGSTTVQVETPAAQSSMTAPVAPVVDPSTTKRGARP